MTVLAFENRFRIALTQAGLLKGYLRDIGIPRPTEYPYLDYSELTPQSQGGQAKQGYINLLWTWDRLNRNQLYLLEAYRSGAGAGLIYLTTDRANGTGPGFDWVDLSAYVEIIQYAPQPGGRGNIVTGVQMRFNAIVVLVAPSTFA